MCKNAKYYLYDIFDKSFDMKEFAVLAIAEILGSAAK